MPDTVKKQRRPQLKACLAFWDPEKLRYRMTTPKTARAAKGIKADAVFLLTATLDSKDAKNIATLRECLAESEIGACFYARGPVTYDMLKALGLE
jgi:hypothetical protein